MTNNNPIDTVPADIIHPVRRDRLAGTVSFVAGLWTADELLAAARYVLGTDDVEYVGRDRLVENFRRR